MRIAIDATPAYCQGAGIGRYSRGLLRSLAAEDHENEYRLLRPRRAQFALPPWPPNFTERVPWFSERSLNILWHHLRIPLPAEVFTGKVDVYYSPDFTLPPLRGARSIVTVHDLSFLVLPECAETKLRVYLTRTVPRAVRRANLVLADSANTKDDLVRLLGVPEERVTVVYPGVEDAYRPIEDEARRIEVAQRLRLERPFLLMVGTLEPRKNLVRLLEAFHKLTQAFPHELIVVGRPGWMYREIYQTVGRLGLHNRVRFLGFLAEEDLPVLYNLADLFVFPSLYEGFGLPPLEAMACGTPVVCSNTSSLPEVVDCAAIQFDPRDVEAMAAAMEEALGNAGRRREMAERGRQQALQFSWERSARQLVKLFEGLES
ncbi:MAG: glycosyltransferase family 4 protein [Bacteroidetes bacterium]|nr:glycosyltransferase family 4 protein [Bacteroidota bacterium]MCL5026291.1 glycosyltransferase family 4 protein [Chloroflexota bacterium]